MGPTIPTHSPTHRGVLRIEKRYAVHLAQCQECDGSLVMAGAPTPTHVQKYAPSMRNVGSNV